jgi:hypothetical protein
MRRADDVTERPIATLTAAIEPAASAAAGPPLSAGSTAEARPAITATANTKALDARPSLRERTVMTFLSFSPEYMSRIASEHIASIEIKDRRGRSLPLSNQGDVVLPGFDAPISWYEFRRADGDEVHDGGVTPRSSFGAILPRQ